jgi:predicted dehydrogenase
VQELQAAAQRGGGRVRVGFQLRFHPTLRLAAERIAAGEIGAVQSVRAHWGEYLPNWHPWEDYRQGYAARSDLGGGVILTLCHPLDYLRFVIGEVSDVWAFTGQSSDLQLPVESSAEIGLRFANGVIGSVHLDYVQQPPTHTLEVIGSEGMLRWNAADGALTVYSPGAQTWQVHLPPEGFDRNWLFIDEMRNFLAVARREAQPACTLEDGIRALQIALAARDSAADGAKKTL